MRENNKDNEVVTKPVPTSLTENKKSNIETNPIKCTVTNTYNNVKK